MGQISVGSLQACLVGYWSAVCWGVFGGVGGRASHCLSFVEGWGGVGPGSGRTGPVAVGSLPVLLLRFKWRLWGGVWLAFSVVSLMVC